MEVRFEYSRYDWVQINTQINTQMYRNWLYSRQPLTGIFHAVGAGEWLVLDRAQPVASHYS